MSIGSMGVRTVNTGMTERQGMAMIGLLMKIIELTNTCLCASPDDQKGEYVFYTGGLAGITDATVLESNAETLQGRPNEVQLDRN